MLSAFVVVLTCFAAVQCELVFNFDSESGPDTGSFWQITDIHHDANYSSPLLAPNLCRVDTQFRNSSTGKVGLFGDHACDSVWALTVSAIESMKSLAPGPDFILWTGDSVPHVNNKYIDLEKIYSLIQNITDKLIEVFPNVTVYPVLGNHDIWPSGQFPVTNESKYYADMLNKAGWNKLLDVSQQKVFEQGCYFSKALRRGLRLIGLNSNLWYNYDTLSQNLTDPAGQIHWLELEMQSARNLSEKVIISGHVPPGAVGRAPMSSAWMYQLFNQRFHCLLQRYSDVITAAIFGHEHTDGFRVVYDFDGKPVVPMFMAPAVTPWNSTMPGMGANNPGIRLYHYSRSSGMIKDYTQFYLNLTEANVLKKANWVPEYRMKKAYELNDVSAASLDELITKFQKDDSPLFQSYYEYNSVSLDKLPCTEECKRRHICSMTKIEFTDFSHCLNGEKSPQTLEPLVSTTPGSHHHEKSTHHHHREVRNFTYYLLGAILILLVILFFVVAFCCCRRRHAVLVMGRSRYTLIQDA